MAKHFWVEALFFFRWYVRRWSGCHSIQEVHNLPLMESMAMWWAWWVKWRSKQVLLLHFKCVLCGLIASFSTVYGCSNLRASSLPHFFRRGQCFSIIWHFHILTPLVDSYFGGYLNVVSSIVIDWVEDMEMAFSPDVRFPQEALTHCSNGGFWKPFCAGICSCWFCFSIILLLLHMGYFRHSPDIKYCKSIQTRFYILFMVWGSLTSSCSNFDCSTLEHGQCPFLSSYFSDKDYVLQQNAQISLFFIYGIW